MAGRVTFRVLFGGEGDARKLTIESGIPNTVEDFTLQIKTFFQVTEPFRLQYRDKEMDDQFMNLSSTSELEDKATVKVVYIPSETTSSNPLRRDASPTIPGTPSSVSSSSYQANDSDSYTSGDTIILSSPETRSCSWPKVFVVPRFSYCAEMILHSGNNEFNAHGTLLSPTPKTRSDILEGLAEEIMKYTAYPKDEQLEEVAKALIQSHPCLLEKGTRGGYCGWKHYLKIKMMNFRSKLSRAGHPEVAVNSLKNKRKGQEKPAANIKKPRKAEVNFCPNIPRGETRESMEVERVALLTELKKKKQNEAEIKKMMQHTFSIRRQEVLQEPAIPEFRDRWPALFDVSEINLEFMRLTTVPLTSKFLGELDRQTDNLIKVFNAKGGVAGRKITAIMAQMDNA
ncbi:sterile alpha motif domain-containing protein 3-like [Trichomycterus rosablanca]|uniref:sterile alpha motif domain-containing protein 3-like n=1 Tax=Trichomycterus rosablanca TaxID=2290929 RepID=UPI002F3556AF